MAQALIPTTWFTDYWLDYRPQAIANLREATAIAAELDDAHLEIEARAASMRSLTPEEQVTEGEAVLEVLESRRDPLRLKEHYFWLMWLYWIRADLERCVEICDRGIELSDQLGTEPVQYPTIKAFALMDLGRFDEAWASLQQEVADEAHRFGAAVQQLGIAVYLERVGAVDAAFEHAKETLKEARSLNRTWMQRWLVDLLEVLAARRGEAPPADFQGEYAPGFSASPIAGAERKLLEGDPEAALELAADIAPKMDGLGMHNAKLQALVLSALALEKLGRLDDAAESAAETLVELDRLGFRSLAWRLHALRARALRAAGDSVGAGREREKAWEIVSSIAATIPDPNHRAAFESDPVAAEILVEEKE
jgi:tetratricopeptide (TPR) repeat protein